jgi:hypothetical protein
MTNVIQALAGEVVSFFEWFGESIEDPFVRKAIFQDLGLDQAAAGATPTVSTSGLDAVKAYRDSASVTEEQGIAALADIATLLDAVAGVVESIAHSSDAAEQEIGHALLEVAASNWVRLRFPRVFLVLQLVSLLEEVTSTYGEGTNNLVRVGDAMTSLWGFLVQPGKSLAQVDTTREHPNDSIATVTDTGVRLAAAVLGVYDGITGVKRIPDVLTGWDGPGLDLDSAQPPARSDVISNRMTSLSLGWDTGAPPTEQNASGRLLITTAMIPADEGGTSLFLALGGSGDIEQPLSSRWMLSIKVRLDAGLAVMLGAGNDIVLPGGPPGAGTFIGESISIASRPDPSSNLSFSVPDTTGTRFEIGTVALTFTVDVNAAELLASLADSALVIDPGDSDGFIAELLGHTPLRLPFAFTIGYSSNRGLVLEGSAPPTGKPAQPKAPLAGAGNVGPPVIAATIPIGRSLGPVTVHEVSLRVTRGPADADPKDMTLTTVEVDTSLSAQIGPVYVRLDQLGLQVTADGSRPPAERNLRFVDLTGPGIKFPRGVAVAVDTAMVTGGGSILHDPDLGIYFGTISLTFRGGTTITALGLVATKNPDGSKGFSLLMIVTVEFGSPYPLPFGFRLEGVGGMLALHRTFDEAAMRAALPTGQLRNVLFPTDPIHHTTETLIGFQTFFPARHGSHLLGVLVKIGWGAPTLIRFELAVVYEFGNRHRLILLGSVNAVLPRQDSPLITLNMDSVGVLDFDAGTFALDAVLHDSKLLSRFVITGAMAMRMTWHDSFGFALAVGGLHPKFLAPAGFPNVARLQLALTNGDNPKLICQAYFGITSNTVQFGADCSLYAAAFGFSITGDVGFDVLIQVLPFHFLASFRASVQLKRGSHNLFKVSVEGELEGPLPLRLAGSAKFEILWCDFSVSFNKTLVDGGPLNSSVPIDATSVLQQALSDPRAWRAELPPAAGQLVTIRTEAGGDGPSATSRAGDSVLLHPQGTLTVRQSAIPLNLTRDLDRVGSSVPAGERRFAITHAAIGPAAATTTSVQEMFAPGQFFDMSDDDRLAAPSYEAMVAGVSFGDGGYTTDVGAAVRSPFSYTDIVIGPDGKPVLQPTPHQPTGEIVMLLAQRSPAALARTRQTLAQRFAVPTPAGPPPTPGAPGGWSVVAIDTGETVHSGQTWAEARVHVTDPARFVLVPRSELAS